MFELRRLAPTVTGPGGIPSPGLVNLFVLLGPTGNFGVEVAAARGRARRGYPVAAILIGEVMWLAPVHPQPGGHPRRRWPLAGWRSVTRSCGRCGKEASTGWSCCSKAGAVTCGGPSTRTRPEVLVQTERGRRVRAAGAGQRQVPFLRRGQAARAALRRAPAQLVPEQPDRELRSADPAAGRGDAPVRGAATGRPVLPRPRPELRAFPLRQHQLIAASRRAT